MNKRLLFIAAGLAATGALAWLLLQWYNERNASLGAVSQAELARAHARQNPDAPVQPPVIAVPPLSPSHRVRLAIGGLGLPGEEENRQLTDLLVAQLGGARNLELVERQDLDRVLAELGLSLSGLVRPKDAVRAGKLLKAEWFLLGTTAAVSPTNNILVARVVDARTGIMRDVSVFLPGKGTTTLAADLAAFVRQCRVGASTPKPRVFLALGSFTDVGVNHRQADFPGRLSAFLLAAYRQSPVTLLEREYADILLQEVRLDLAGLSDSSGQPTPMQSAFWLVDGFYQSFETSGFDVEVVLQVQRVFGLQTSRTLRGQPSEALFGNIKSAIDAVVAGGDPLVLAPTRKSELLLQLRSGKELFKTATGNLDPVTMPSAGYRRVDAGEPDSGRRARFLNEAVRAFQTALLLDPENHEARFFLSACYRDWGLARYDEGANLLRELATAQPEDEWPNKARVALAWFFSNTDGRESAKWFAEAGRHAQDSNSIAYFRAKADEALASAFKQDGNGPTGAGDETNKMAVLETELLDKLRHSQSFLEGHPISGTGIDATYGLESFIEVFGNDRQAAADYLTNLLPRLTARFPALEPHLLSSVVSFQVNTNAPIIAEFRKSVAVAAEHPDSIVGARQYFEFLLLNSYRWCFRNKMFALAAELGEAKCRAATEAPVLAFEPRDKVRLAFAYLRLERWQEALSVLDELGETSIVMQADGPWGPAWTPYVPSRSAALCREKLGLPPAVAAGHFTLDKPSLCMHSPSAFALSDDALWIGIAGKLLKLDFDLHTNKQVTLPLSPLTPITSALAGPNQIWVGTAGEGLVQYDVGTGQCRHFTEAEGLLLNDITALYLQDQNLWVGFGREGAGGLGRLELTSGKCSSLSAALPSDPLNASQSDPPDGPPRHAVSSLAGGPSGDLWMLVSRAGLRQLKSSDNTWQSFNYFGDQAWLHSFALKGQTLIGGFSLARSNSYAGQLRQRPLNENQWQNLTDDSALLPAAPDRLVLNGAELWLGGGGYLAVFDLNQNKLRKLCYIPARTVDQLALAGGYLWAKFDRHLYRAPLSATK
jgi:hypothetical protein